MKARLFFLVGSLLVSLSTEAAQFKLNDNVWLGEFLFEALSLSTHPLIKKEPGQVSLVLGPDSLVCKKPDWQVECTLSFDEVFSAPGFMDEKHQAFYGGLYSALSALADKKEADERHIVRKRFERSGTISIEISDAKPGQRIFCDQLDMMGQTKYDCRFEIFSRIEGASVLPIYEQTLKQPEFKDVLKLLLAQLDAEGYLPPDLNDSSLPENYLLSQSLYGAFELTVYFLQPGPATPPVDSEGDPLPQKARAGRKLIIEGSLDSEGKVQGVFGVKVAPHALTGGAAF